MLIYCIQAWRHCRKNYIDTLEIQSRVTKMISELRDVSYEERLKECFNNSRDKSVKRIST